MAGVRVVGMAFLYKTAIDGTKIALISWLCVRNTFTTIDEDSNALVISTSVVVYLSGMGRILSKAFGLLAVISRLIVVYAIVLRETDVAEIIFEISIILTKAKKSLTAIIGVKRISIIREF